MDLQQFWLELKILRGFKAVGKADTEEAKRHQEELQKKVKAFGEKHPDITIPDETLKEIFE